MKKVITAKQWREMHSSKGKRRGKYNAIRTPGKDCAGNDRTFDSTLEAKIAGDLQALKSAGEITGWIRQVKFDLPGNTSHRIDFLVFLPDGRYRLIEAKGYDHPAGIKARKQVQGIYGIKIEVLKK